MNPDPQESPPLDDEPLGRPRPLLAVLAVLIAAAMVAAALGGRSFVGPEAPTPDPTRTAPPAQAHALSS
jgi:hypothetical protein